MEKPVKPEQPIREEMPETSLSNKQMRRRTFIAFGSFAVLQTAAYFSWRKLYTSPDEITTATAGAHKPLRKALNKTELVFRRIFSNNHLVKTYPKELAVKNVRVNEVIGVSHIKPGDWRLNVHRGPGDILQIPIEDIKALPKTEIIYDFKCVEGWDQIQHWAGVKFADFVTHYKLDKLAQMDYVGMATSDNAYYVGLDKESAMHPQTLLAYEMNDQPIAGNHGAPLRLIIPVKYGIKNIKQISSITFSNSRPPDYWAEQGYDYYSGL